MNKFKDLHKSSNKLQYIDKIIWNANLQKEKRLIIDDLLTYIQSTYTDFINKTKADLIMYKDYKILGHCLSNSNEYMEYLYLLSDYDMKAVYISVGRCHPVFWYKFTTKKDFYDNFDQIYETYTRSYSDIDNNNNNKYIRACIGNAEILDINIHDIENNLLLQKYTDKLIYGSMWNDHPFRKEYMNKVVTPMNNIILTGQAMRQDLDEDVSPYSVSVRTQYSKSLITIYDFDGTFILEVEYTPIHTKQINNINTLFGFHYNIDMPIDLLLCIYVFPFLTHSDVLKMRPLTPYHMYLLNILVGHDGNLMIEMEPELKNILKNRKQDKFDKIVYQIAKKIIELSTNYKVFLKILESNDMKNILKTHLGEDDITEIEELVNELQQKYNCVNDEHIKDELINYIMNKIDL